MPSIPPIKSIRYKLIDLLLKYDEEKEQMLAFTKRLTMLLANGPHDKKFAKEATAVIAEWYWDILDSSSGKKKGSGDEKVIQHEAEEALLALKF